MTGASSALPVAGDPVVRFARAGWAVLAAAGVVLAGTALAHPLGDAVAQSAFVLAWVAAAVLIVRRRPGSPSALCAAVFLSAFPLMFTGIADTVLPRLPAVGGVLNVLGGASFLLFAYTFPDGRFVPGWTRWVALCWAGALVLDEAARLHGVSSSGALGAARQVAWIVSLGSAIAVQVHRYRRVSDPRERDQAKWVSYGIVVGVGGFVVAVLLDQLGALGPEPSAEAVLTPLAYGLVSVVPVCLGIAILRHRLWDIDQLINRTLVYVLLSATAFGAYTAVVTVLGATVGAVGLPASAAAIALLAVALHPAHVRLQRLVNRLLYGRRDDPYSVLAELGQQLGTTTSSEGVLPTIVRTTASALRLPYVAIALAGPGGQPRVAAAAGEPGEVTAGWPLEQDRENVGLLLASPRRGDSFSDADRRLLSDLAARAGAAVHAAALARDLERARAQLVMAREEERRRLHRDLHDHLGATLSALTIKAGAAHALLGTDAEGAAAAIEEVEHELQGSVSEVRRLVYALRPPALDDRGLCAAIEDQLVQPRTGLSVELLVDPEGAWPSLPAAVELAAYRITQEALTNAARHSGARHCRIALSLREEEGSPALVVEVSDDGRGLPGALRRGVGLDSMQERAAELGGTCSIGGDRAGGVRVTAVLPLSAGTAR